MLSTGHFLVTILLIGREILYPIGAFILIRQWLNAKARYYTDLPFLFGLAMLIMCIYTPIEIICVGFYPLVTIDSSLGKIVYLIILNLTALVLGINFVILLVIWFPKHKKGTLGSTIGWISFTEIAIILSAFVNVALMDILLIAISLPMYIIFVITFLFSYYHKRLPNIHPLLIGLGMSIIIISHIIHSILGQVGIRLGGIYTDATWPAMIIWLVGFVVMFLGFIRKAPYYNSINTFSSSTINI